MLKKEKISERGTEIDASKRRAGRRVTVGAKAIVPVHKAAVMAERKPRKVVKKEVVQKNDRIEDGKEDRKYFVKWIEKDFKRTDQEVWFYRVSLVASVLGMLWALYDGNLLTFLTFFMSAVVIFFEFRWEPRDVEYEVNMDGVSVNKKFYRFGEIKSFEITKKGDASMVKFQLKNSIFPVKEMYLDAEQDLPFMRALFRHFLPEETQEEKLFNFTRAEKKLTDEEYIDKKVNEYLKGKN